MKPSELYKLWATEDSIWSKWAKPVLFADVPFGSGEPARSTQWLDSNVAWAPAPGNGTAIVLDLPNDGAIRFGLALSQRGYRPVPLYNGVRGPLGIVAPLVSVDAIVWALHSAADILMGLRLTASAPPVFLLDSHRMANGAFASPGRFDNRWCTFPQDFPSANFLLSHGIRSVVLAQALSAPPQSDLAHILLRWQEAGIQILASGIYDQMPPLPIRIERPGNFRALWYRALVLAGLYRNSAGGFGAIIPEPSSSGGYG